MTETCPACAQPASGRFCSHCGANLEAPVTCTECGNELPVGGRFCNHCGAATPATRTALATEGTERPAHSNLPWYIAGAALVALIAVLLVPRFRQEEAPAAQAPFAAAAPAGASAGAPAGDPRAVDLSSMTPRQAADRLFNRVMQAVSTGDSTQAKSFLPMAIAAYDRVPDLDADGHYHVAVLNLVGNDAQSARARADSILQSDPNHLFGLFTAGQAEQTLGNAEAARGFYQRFLDQYDSEVARGLQEYTEHEPVLTPMREEARRAVEG